MRSSIRQVAEHAHVSPMTVSRVVRGRKHQVNEETYKRVLAAMHELNYVPISSTVQNRHVETSTIGFVPHNADAPDNPIDRLTNEGLCRECRRHGYDVLVLLRDEADWMANRAVVRFLDRRSDGFILVSPRTGEWKEMLEILTGQDLPIVVCYRRDVPEGVAWVDPDNDEIMRLTTGHLLEQGHTRIAHVLGASPSAVTGTIEVGERKSEGDHFDDTERQKYFLQHLKEGGNPDAIGLLLRAGDSNWNLLPGTVDLLVSEGVTGAICGEATALQLWDQAEAAGIRVPQDLSIVGIDNQSAGAHRGLTSVSFGYGEVGRLAVNAWVQLKNGTPAAQASQVVPVQLVQRSSVRRIAVPADRAAKIGGDPV